MGEFIKFCETKLWNLHIEEVIWRKANKKELTKLRVKIERVVKTKREKELYVKSSGWNQQTGKMIFISAILRDFFKKSRIPNKVWKERKWKLSRDGNYVLTMPKKESRKRKVVKQ